MKENHWKGKIMKIFKNSFWLSCLFIFAWNCGVPDSENQAKEIGPYHPSHFSNILNVSGFPQDVSDRSVYAFADQGAWFAYSLPIDKDLYGSFMGPFLMTERNGFWVNPCISKLEVYDLRLGEPYKLKEAAKINISSYPGKLKQTFEFDNPRFALSIELIFATDQTSLVWVEVKRLDDKKPLNLGIRWKGKSLTDDLSFSKMKDGILVNLVGKSQNAMIKSTGGEHAEMFANPKNYHIQLEKAQIPMEGWRVGLTHSFFSDHRGFPRENAKMKEVLSDPPKFIAENEDRWTQMLEATLAGVKQDQQKLAVKCLQTLMTNWRAPAGFLKHDGLFPSYNYEWFHGFWAWDSWKHAVALAKIHPELAKNQILAMFDFQNERGMIADCVYRDTVIEAHNWRNSKPPLAAWAAWKVFEQTKDTSFLQQLYPKLAQYHQWWYTDRDHDQNGLCEYGSTDGTLKAAKWESGMDNAVRFDEAKILKNNDFAWSMNQESVDLNAYLYAEKKYLALICGQIGQEQAEKKYLSDAEILKTKVQETFYDEESGWFYDVNIDSKEPILVQSPEGWIPLWAEIATAEQAAAVHQILLDENKFSTRIPFPTLAADHPKFSPEKGYWRGPVWLDQAYFAIEGLKNYGFSADAARYSQQLMDNVKGLKSGQDPIQENYHPLTGKGQGAKHFSWSAAHLLLLLQP